VKRRSREPRELSRLGPGLRETSAKLPRHPGLGLGSTLPQEHRAMSVRHGGSRTKSGMTEGVWQRSRLRRDGGVLGPSSGSPSPHPGGRRGPVGGRWSPSHQPSRLGAGLRRGGVLGPLPHPSSRHPGPRATFAEVAERSFSTVIPDLVRDPLLREHSAMSVRHGGSRTKSGMTEGVWQRSRLHRGDGVTGASSGPPSPHPGGRRSPVGERQRVSHRPSDLDSGVRRDGRASRQGGVSEVPLSSPLTSRTLR
jgi:hypothetical protein